MIRINIQTNSTNWQQTSAGDGARQQNKWQTSLVTGGRSWFTRLMLCHYTLWATNCCPITKHRTKKRYNATLCALMQHCKQRCIFIALPFLCLQGASVQIVVCVKVTKILLVQKKNNMHNYIHNLHLINRSCVCNAT